MDSIVKVQELLKAIEAGSYNVAPEQLRQGSSLQIEDMSNTMKVVTADEKAIKLQKKLKSESCKSMLAQFNRQLSYGQFGGSAQFEGNLGQEETSDYERAVIPMAFYSHYRRTTLQANLVATFDGTKAEDRSSADAAKKILFDIEFDCFRGMDDFSDAGVFNGNPNAIPRLPNMHGVGLQVRQSDAAVGARDLMFAEYGADDSVVLPGGGTLTQEQIEDAMVRSRMNHGEADMLMIDPITIANYNKLALAKERIILGGSPQDATGSELRRQWTSNGECKIEASRFLSGKSKPQRARAVKEAPLAPASVTPTSVTDSANVTAFESGEVYRFYATAGSEVGEGPKCATVAVTVAAKGDKLSVSIAHPSGGVYRFFNVYRGAAGAAVGQEKFIGRVLATPGAGPTVYTDLGNKIPAFVTGYLVDSSTMGMKELAPFSSVDLAVTDLSTPKAFYRFTTLAMYEPRKNVLIESLA